MRNTAVLLRPTSALVLCLTLCGCTTISDCKYEIDQKYRAHQAWCAFDGCQDQCFTGDYRTGWKAGYYDVATGGTGCPPVVPPKRYWHPPVCFEHDPCRRNDWYCGWQDGAACAKCEPDFHHLQAWMQCGPMCCQTTPASHQTFPMDMIHEAPPTDPTVTDEQPVTGGPVTGSEDAIPMPMPGEPITPAAPGSEAVQPEPGYENDPMPPEVIVPPADAPQPNVQRRLPADFISVQRLVENARRQQSQPQQPAARPPVPKQATATPVVEPSRLQLLVKNATHGNH